jgi:hypothetical protein
MNHYSFVHKIAKNRKMYTCLNIFLVIFATLKSTNMTTASNINCIEQIVLLDFIHRLVSEEQTKSRN